MKMMKTLNSLLFLYIYFIMKEKRTIIISVILLSLFGLLMIYSSSYVWAEYKYNNPYKYLINQSIFLIIGYIVFIISSKINYRIYYKYSNYILIISLILLSLVLIPGVGILRNGSRSWFGFGSFSIQPSELSKIGLTIFISKFLSNNNSIRKNTKTFVFPSILVILITFGLIMLEPDFGTGFVLTISLITLLFVSGTKFSFFIKIGILGLLGIAGLIIAAPYRLARIVSFINPWVDPLGSGFQIIQSLYAIGPGGIFGLGLFNSRQKHFYLPEPQTDFIFSIICEELGLPGALLVITLFLLIIINSIKIALKQNDLFAKYLCFGLIFCLSFQTILNMAVVIGLVPVTGVTLPFLSYGGSSLLISLYSIGIIINISNSKR